MRGRGLGWGWAAAGFGDGGLDGGRYGDGGLGGGRYGDGRFGEDGWAAVGSARRRGAGRRQVLATEGWTAADTVPAHAIVLLIVHLATRAARDGRGRKRGLE